MSNVWYYSDYKNNNSFEELNVFEFIYGVKHIGSNIFKDYYSDYSVETVNGSLSFVEYKINDFNSFENILNIVKKDLKFNDVIFYSNVVFHFLDSGNIRFSFDYFVFNCGDSMTDYYDLKDYISFGEEFSAIQYMKYDYYLGSKEFGVIPFSLYINIFEEELDNYIERILSD